MSIKSKTLLHKIKRNKPYFEDFITRSVFNSNRIGEYINYLDDKNIKTLSNMINNLCEFEKKRMEQFGIIL